MRCSRRRFLASAAAGVVAAHAALARASASPAPSAGKHRGVAPRIRQLHLATATPLETLEEFYGRRLGLRVVERGASRLTVAGGTTSITFERTEAEGPGPFYHFAFNIPENKIRAARDWQLERGPLLAVPPGSRDPDYPDDVVHFRHWNAHSVFFFDPAENVVEYIARHDLDNRSSDPFGSRDILYASEIALIVDDVPAAAAEIGETFALAQYSRASREFHALGDEEGLVLIFRRGRKLSLGHEPAKHAGVFPTRATLAGPPGARHRVPGFPYELTAP